MHLCDPFLSGAPHAYLGALWGSTCTPVKERWFRTWKFWSTNLPINTFAFAAYFKSGGLKQKIITKGGVVEKKLRTTATEFIELQNDLDVNAKFLSKTVLQLYQECHLRRFPKISKRAQNWFGCLEVFNNPFLRLNIVNPSVETDFQMHDNLRIAASSMEPNTGWPKKMCTHENFNCDFD